MFNIKRSDGHHHHFHNYIFSLVVLTISGGIYGYFNNYFTELILLQTSYGKVQGFAQLSRDGRKFYQFNAIPYARPPEGELRFKPPVPIAPWDFVDGTGMTPVCPQFDMTITFFRGQEDCLFLNIFTNNIPIPQSPVKKLLPVMIFIHGGIFMFGGSWEFYGGRYFMDEEVVFVTLNYRLGVLGFLNTGDGLVSGNFGLMDQLEAFRFLKRIVGDFGGDPNRITIFGHSAGGASVHYHMMSPQSKGTFQYAISQAGSALSPWAFQKSPLEQAIRLGGQVGCPTTSSRELVDCLQSLDVWRLIEPHQNFLDVFIDPLDIYAPTVENVTSEVSRANAFLTEYPYKLAAEGKTQPIPWIAGVNSHDGCVRSAWILGQKKLTTRLNKEWDIVAPKIFFLFNNDSRTLTNLRKYYFPQGEVTPKEYQSLTNLVGDRYFTVPVRDAVLLHAKHHHRRNASTYLYYYSHRGDITFGNFMAIFTMDKPAFIVLSQLLLAVGRRLVDNWLGIKGFDYGACHSDELFQFMTPNAFTFLDISPGHPHYQFSKDMVKAWATFAHDGKPGHFNGVPWEELNLTEGKTNISAQLIPKYLHLNPKQPEMIEEPCHSRLPFWRRLKVPRSIDPEHESRYDYDVL